MIHIILETLQYTYITQYEVKKGMQVLGQAGSDAIITNMQQLHTRKSIEPKKEKMLTHKYRNDSLKYFCPKRRKYMVR